MKCMVFRVFIINSVSLGLLLCVMNTFQIFTCYHSDQRALRGREEDVTLNVVGPFQDAAANKVKELHSEFAFIIIFTKHQRLSRSGH